MGVSEGVHHDSHEGRVTAPPNTFPLDVPKFISYDGVLESKRGHVDLTRRGHGHRDRPARLVRGRLMRRRLIMAAT